MEGKPVTMNTIPILYELIVSTLSNVSSPSRKTLSEPFVLDLLNRTTLKFVQHTKLPSL